MMQLRKLMLQLMGRHPKECGLTMGKYLEQKILNFLIWLGLKLLPTADIKMTLRVNRLILMLTIRNGMMMLLHMLISLLMAQIQPLTIRLPMVNLILLTVTHLDFVGPHVPHPTMKELSTISLTYPSARGAQCACRVVQNPMHTWLRIGHLMGPRPCT